jgi:6-phosphogluconolactonase (cycloisomerase 2 family)
MLRRVGASGGQRPRRRAAAEDLERRVLLSGAVFVATNHINVDDPDEPANEVVMYERDDDGVLAVVGRFNTGGQGSGPSVRFAGDGLGSAHSVEVSQDQCFLFVTNGGSENLSVFRIHRHSLELVELQSTPFFPNSVTQHGNRVYVLSNGHDGDGRITGYRLSSSGQLTPISNSERSLDANQDGERPDVLFNQTQVSFTPDGRKLVVTIKDGPEAGAIPGVTPTGEGRVLVFDVDSAGRPSEDFVQTELDNDGPFGFSFDEDGNLITSLFVGGPEDETPRTSAVGSFEINDDNTLTPITRSLLNGQLDTCWIENNGEFAFSANYGSSTVSSYRINDDGSLELLEGVAGEADDLPGTDDDPAGDTVTGGQPQGATPLDIRVTPNGDFLYNILPGSGTVAGWQINDDGSLTKIGEFGGVGKTIAGDVAPKEFGTGDSPAGIAAVDFDDVDGPSNVLYVMTNSPQNNRNHILAYRRNPDTGELTFLSEHNTGGTGFLNEDDRIGPDDSDQEVIVSRDRRFLYAVNQGSHTIATFRIRDDGRLQRIQVTGSGGEQPVSLGLFGETIVAVNKGDQDPGGGGGDTPPNYVTFRVRDNGTLSRVPGSTIEIKPGSSPTQALISPDGDFVFGDNFLTRPVDEIAPFLPPFGSELESFRLSQQTQTLSRGEGSPYPSPLDGVPNQYILGMQVHPTHRVLYVGFVVSNQVGVYTYDNQGRLEFQRAVSTGAGAGVCWLVTSRDGTRMYGTNFATNSVAVFDISDPLNPVLLEDQPLNGPKDPQPTDPPSPAQFATVAFQETLSPNGRTLYVLNHEQHPRDEFPDGNQVHVLRVADDGTLTEVETSPLILPRAFVPRNAHPMGIVAI